MTDDGQEDGARDASERRVRIEGVVTCDEDRAVIMRAADAAGTSASRFIGQAALAAASGEGFQIARLEHVTDVQETLAAQLLELRDGQRSVAATGAALVAQHEETHRRLGEALERLSRAQEQITHTLEAQIRVQGQLAEAMDAHRETNDRLVAMLGPVQETCRTVTTGLAVINEIADGLAASGYVCEQVTRLARHLGLDPGEPPPGCGEQQAVPPGAGKGRAGGGSSG